MTDNTVTLRHPHTSKEATGYYRVSGKTLRSFGFVRLKRGNTRVFLAALTLLIDFALLPSALLLFPDMRKILLASPPFFDGTVPLLACLLPALGLSFVCGTPLVAGHANRLHTAERLKHGYAPPSAAINLDEARAALKLPPSRTIT